MPPTTPGATASSDGPVAVALSGGVDSALAAVLLQDAGYPLIGVMARLYDPSCAAPRGCCDEQTARALCAHLGVEFYAFDLSADFASSVTQPFIDAYAQGLTPNPCLRCNRYLKFTALRRAVEALGVSALATGHYVTTGVREGRPGLAVAFDRDKDQSYMLLLTPPEALTGALFPLAKWTKPRVLAEALRRNLPFVSRESQDLCFVPGSLSEYLAAHLPLEPGPVLDLQGRRLGAHQGLPLYTIGQRPRIPGLTGGPLFVIARDPNLNALLVGPRELLARRYFRASEPNWISLPPPAPGQPLQCLARIRYRAPLIPASVTLEADAQTFTVALEPHDQAIAPGQGVALYDDAGWLLGGGIICDDAPN